MSSSIGYRRKMSRHASQAYEWSVAWLLVLAAASMALFVAVVVTR